MILLVIEEYFGSSCKTFREKDDNVHEKHANLLCKKSSCQCDLSCLPSLLCLGCVLC